MFPSQESSFNIVQPNSACTSGAMSLPRRLGQPLLNKASLMPSRWIGLLAFNESLCVCVLGMVLERFEQRLQCLLKLADGKWDESTCVLEFSMRVTSTCVDRGFSWSWCAG